MFVTSHEIPECTTLIVSLLTQWEMCFVHEAQTYKLLLSSSWKNNKHAYPHRPPYSSVPARPSNQGSPYDHSFLSHFFLISHMYSVDYADLAIIDLRNFATTAEERGKLALQVREAMSSQGFCYVIGHGYSSEQVGWWCICCYNPNPHSSLIRDQMKRMFDIADVPFSRVSHDEKEKYLASTKQAGSFQGYKLRQYWVTPGNVFYLGSELDFSPAHRQRRS